MIPFDGLSNVMEGYLRDRDWVNDVTGPGRVQLVGIRGCKILRDRNYVAGISLTLNDESVTNKYDDTMVCWGRKSGGERFSSLMPMSTQPGIKSFFLSCYKPAGKGCPTVQAGQFKYKRGLHKQKYPALVQAGSVVAIRDVDKDLKVEPGSDTWDYPFGTGINIHAGGTSPLVDYSSSGCQVIQGGYSGDYWKMLRAFVYDVGEEQSLFNYVLAAGSDLASWYNMRQKGIVIFARFFGSVGDVILSLRDALIARGYHPQKYDESSRYFGATLHASLRLFQKRVGLPITGVFTVREATKLGVDV